MNTIISYRENWHWKNVTESFIDRKCKTGGISTLRFLWRYEFSSLRSYTWKCYEHRNSFKQKQTCTIRFFMYVQHIGKWHGDVIMNGKGEKSLKSYDNLHWSHWYKNMFNWTLSISASSDTLLPHFSIFPFFP